MAIGALQIVFAAHVHIQRLVGKYGLVEIAVLDAVAATAIEMAFAAVLTRGGANAARYGQQVDAVCGIAEQALAIGAGSAWQARQSTFSGLACWAARPRPPSHSRRGSSCTCSHCPEYRCEVVDLVDLADGLHPSRQGTLKGLDSQVQWVVRISSAAAFVADQAGTGDLLPFLKSPLTISA